jgi:hypothetical protein
MFNQYFGNYLLEKKVINSNQLKEVLESQISVKVKLGVLAINSGYMNASEVSHVHSLQTIRDEKFGEIALNEGYLTIEKLNELLTKQKESLVLLGQALIDKGYISINMYQDLLSQYKQDSGFTSEELDSIQNNDIEKIVSVLLKSKNYKNKEIISKYTELFIKQFIRFIDHEIFIEKPEIIDFYDFEDLVYQKIEGDYSIFSGFAGSNEVMKNIASIYAEDLCVDSPEIIEDSVKEFLNGINGLFLSGLSNSGIDLELSIPSFQRQANLNTPNKMYKFQCNLNFGSVYLLICTEYPLIKSLNSK